MNGPASAGLNVPAELDPRAVNRERPRALVVDALVVAGFKLLVSALVLARGFRAISDDDYARIVIAQRFAEAPALDPSGTSWLPLPFWLYGIAFSVAGPSLAVARGVALLLGALAALLVWAAASSLGANRAGALLAGLLAAALPHSAWLGAATVPEALSAALTAFGVAAATSENTRRRLAGGLALGAACWCRYEAWSVTAAIAAWTMVCAVRRRDAKHFAPAAIALAPIAFWLVNGALRHGDALFFWKRVTGYKQALGGASELGLALRPLVDLVQKEPHLCLALALALLLVTLRAPRVRPLPRPALLVWAALVLLGSLMLGEASGGAPTHHPERALLPLWYLGTAALGTVFGELTRPAAARRASPGGLVRSPYTHVAALVLAACLLRASAPSGFVDRAHALDIGARARALGAPALLIDSEDYAYLAVTAAFGRPNHAVPFDDHDPRHARSADVSLDGRPLRESLARTPGAFLVATRAHEQTARQLGSIRAENAEFLLIEPH